MNDIILTGPKHSGKTSAGKALAELNACDFIDLDEHIIQITGKTPRQLYTESPALFQKAEVEAFSAISFTENNQRIIAAGGGIIDNPEALAALKRLQSAKTAIVVCLNISAEKTWQRITNSAGRELPPFLQTENPQQTHRALHERRAAAYLQLADIVIEADGKLPEQIAAEIQSMCLT